MSTPIALQKEQPLENWQPIETVGAYQDLVVYEDNAINSGKAGFKVYHLFQNGDGTFYICSQRLYRKEFNKKQFTKNRYSCWEKNIKGTTLLNKTTHL